MHELDHLSWAIGIIEGEGTFGVKDRRIRVAMTDKDVILRLHKHFGGRIIGPYQPYEHWKPQWTWFLSTWDVVEPFLKTILPHLSERRQAQAQAVLDNPPHYGRKSQDDPCPRGHVGEFTVSEKRRWCRACMRERNQARAQKDKSSTNS